MSLHLTFAGNKPYTVCAQSIRVTLLAARFIIYLLDMLAKALHEQCHAMALHRISLLCIIIIKKRLAVQGWERVMYTISVWRPQPQYQPIDRKGKRVDDYSRDRAIVEESLTSDEYVSLFLILILNMYTWNFNIYVPIGITFKEKRTNCQPEKITQVKRTNAPFLLLFFKWKH